MLRKWLAFSGLLALVILLDPTHTPAQPGFGKGDRSGGGFGDRSGGFGQPGGSGQPGGFGAPGGFGQPGSGGPGFGRPSRDGGFGQPGGDGNTRIFMQPGSGGPQPGGFGQPGSGGPGFGRPSGGFGDRGPGGFSGAGPGGGMGDRGPGGFSGAYGPPGGGMGDRGGFGDRGPGMGGDRGPGGPGGPGGPRRSDPEQGWRMLQNLTQSTGDTIDLSKIPPQTHTLLRGWAERSGGIPLPETGIMTKAAYFDHTAKSEQAKADFAARGGSSSMSMDPRGSDRMRMEWGGGDRMRMEWGGTGEGGMGPGGWGDRRNFERKELEEERPIALRYGKIPETVKAALPSWYDELDTDKDAQVSLYEWRHIGKREMKDFLKMDLNGDGLVTVDEFLRFSRQDAIANKVKAFEDGEREAGGWNLYQPLDPKASGGGDRPPRGPGMGPGFGPGSKGGEREKGGDNKSSEREKSGEREKGKNPWSKGGKN